MEWELRLLGCWQLLRNGTTVPVGARQQRLIAALALLGQRPRSFLAGLLWPESTEQQASGSLRATVFKLRHQLPGLLGDAAEPVSLAPTVVVDVDGLRRSAEAARAGHPLSARQAERFYSAELLPGWYEDWVIFEQERLRELRIAALEAVAQRCLAEDDPHAAIAAAMHAAAIEPLRESAHALVIRGQLRAGNAAGAHRTLEDFRRRLRDEMGLSPSRRLEAAIGGNSADDFGLPGPLAAKAHADRILVHR
ncbi:BTAD domain-containing putative transcriptional regulator [Sinomonas sp. JGH33]|uniref:BTAD domain-containing putative transcriptional regulator n=1 Tax=Sinomonas terricola TaxID=3110330 RepID=A0ABU5T9F8_9MICC|nr:BTAD domain-containing putative transcriptional regulator [Sinomonas sp. JGH33]MEA5456307.1 BTAD domain-containing putative transcriptional regulator [Sinomonas sp. JGH33]